MKRIPQLDSVRAVAILAVFVHHAVGVMLLWSGVDLFFILSGFLITNILIESKHHSLAGYFSRFYERRARRILGPYLLTLIVVSLFFGTAWLSHWYLYILFTNFLIPLHLNIPQAFDPLWSLAVEEQFYMVWPFAVFFLSVRRLKHLSIALILIAPILRGTILFSDTWPIYMLTPFRMDLLALGALLSLGWRKRRDLIERYGLTISLLCMGGGLAALVVEGHFGVTRFANTRLGNFAVYEATLVFWFGFLLYALAGKYVGWLRIAPLRYIGRISYTMYLIHFMIVLLLRGKLHQPMLAISSLILTVIYASTSWFLMEKPLLEQGNKQRALAA